MWFLILTTIFFFVCFFVFLIKNWIFNRNTPSTLLWCHSICRASAICVNHVITLLEQERLGLITHLRGSLRWRGAKVSFIPVYLTEENVRNDKRPATGQQKLFVRGRLEEPSPFFTLLSHQATGTSCVKWKAHGLYGTTAHTPVMLFVPVTKPLLKECGSSFRSTFPFLACHLVDCVKLNMFLQSLVLLSYRFLLHSPNILTLTLCSMSEKTDRGYVCMIWVVTYLNP